MDLDKLFGNKTASSALLFISRYEEGTVAEISKAFKIPKSQIYLQLVKLENSGFISSRTLGNTRLYSFNIRSPLKNELRTLLEKYIEVGMPIEQNKDFYMIRRRPRTRGKTLGGAYK